MSRIRSGRRRVRTPLALSVALVACVEPVAMRAPDETSAANDSNAADGTLSTTNGQGSANDSGSTGTGTSTSTDAERDTLEASGYEVDSGGDGCAFACPEPGGGGGGGVGLQCDVWSQDCPREEKCMPWANDGGGTWNATRCSPLDPSPAQVGDPCVVAGSGVSGVDNCDIAAMCWDVDPETNRGTCVGFCMGTEASNGCDEPSHSCVIANEGVLILCLPECDPLLQDCVDGQGCYPIDAALVCAPDVSEEGGAYGDPCEFINVCDPGLFCANAEVVPDCAGTTGCCSAFCDVTDPDATASCPGAANGQECVAFFEPGQVPAELQHIGACAIPP